MKNRKWTLLKVSLLASVVTAIGGCPPPPALPEVTLGVDNTTLVQEASTATVTASLDVPASKDVTVVLAFGGSAVVDQDYTRSADQITIDAGETSGSITVTREAAGLSSSRTIEVSISDVDNAVEVNDQIVTITLAAEDGGNGGGGGTGGTGGDDTPSVQLSVPGADPGSTTIPEAGGQTTVTATLSAAASSDVTVNLAFSGTAGSDDYSTSGQKIVIPAGQTSGSITVTATQDTVFEGDETVLVSIFSLSGATAGGRQQVVITIIDDDTVPVVTLSMSSPLLAEAGGTAVVRANLSSAIKQDVVVNLSFEGTAVRGQNFTVSGEQIVIVAGSTTGEITLVGQDNLVPEPAKMIVIKVVNVVNANLGQPTEITVVIIDDDGPGVTLIEPDGITIVAESGATDTILVVLSMQPAADVEVTLDTDTQLDLGNGPGEPLTLTFTPSDHNVPQEVTVKAVDDSVAEGPHFSTITATVSSSDPDYDGIAVGVVDVMIQDNDFPGIIVSPAMGLQVSEDGQTAMYTVRLATQPTAEVVVTVTPDAQLDVSNGGGNSLDLTFTAQDWDMPQEVTVAAVDDLVAEGPHTGLIAHVASSEDTRYSGRKGPDVMAQIADNDTPGVTLSSNALSVSEGGAADSYTIVLNSRPSQDVEIVVDPDVQLDVGEGAGVPLSLIFTPDIWDVPQEVIVEAVDDAVVEGPHSGTITHTISTGDSFYSALTIPNVTAQIEDNDAGGIVVDVSNNPYVIEGGRTDRYQVFLESQPRQPVDITATPDAQLNLGNGSGAPVTLTFTSANWNTPQEVTITATDDMVAQGTHWGTITHSVTSEDPVYTGYALPNITVEIGDNDYPGVLISEGDGVQVTEGGEPDTYSIVLESQPMGDVMISAAPEHGHVDLSRGPGIQLLVTFTPETWNVPIIITVAAVDNQVPDDDRTTTITHTVISDDRRYHGIYVRDVTVIVLDNDE